MSHKLLDEQGRWRSITVGFRVSPEEDRLIERLVHMSGLTKQDYITKRLLNDEVIVQGNPRVYKALKDELAEVLRELRRIEAGANVNADLLRTIHQLAVIMGGMKEESLR